MPLKSEAKLRFKNKSHKKKRSHDFSLILNSFACEATLQTLMSVSSATFAEMRILFAAIQNIEIIFISGKLTKSIWYLIYDILIVTKLLGKVMQRRILKKNFGDQNFL